MTDRATIFTLCQMSPPPSIRLGGPELAQVKEEAFPSGWTNPTHTWRVCVCVSVRVRVCVCVSLCPLRCRHINVTIVTSLLAAR